MVRILSALDCFLKNQFALLVHLSGYNFFPLCIPWAKLFTSNVFSFLCTIPLFSCFTSNEVWNRQLNENCSNVKNIWYIEKINWLPKKNYSIYFEQCSRMFLSAFENVFVSLLRMRSVCLRKWSGVAEAVDQMLRHVFLTGQPGNYN